MGSPTLAERPHERLPVLEPARRDDDKHRDLLAVPLLRDHRQRRRGREVDDPGHLVRRTVGAQSRNARRSSRASRRDRRSARRRSRDGSGCSAELELRHDPEVAAAAAEAPQQVGVLRLARVDEPAVRRDDVGRDEVVARKAELPHRPADAAAEREAGDAGRRHEASGRREAVRLRLVVDVRPDGAAADHRTARGRVDPNAAHRPEVDHDAVVDGREPGDAVAAAAHGDRQVVAAGEADRRDHVRRARCSGRRARACGRRARRSRRGTPRRSRRPRASRPHRERPRAAPGSSPRPGSVPWSDSSRSSFVGDCGPVSHRRLCSALAGTLQRSQARRRRPPRRSPSSRAAYRSRASRSSAARPVGVAPQERHVGQADERVRDPALTPGRARTASASSRAASAASTSSRANARSAVRQSVLARPQRSPARRKMPRASSRCRSAAA